MAPPQKGEGRGPAIKVLVKAPWTALPRHIFTDLRLKPAARLLLLYLLSLSQIPGWQIHLYSHVLPGLGVLEGSWPGIRKNLESCGYYRQRKRRGADGRLWIEHLITDQPGVFDTDEGDEGEAEQSPPPKKPGVAKPPVDQPPVVKRGVLLRARATDKKEQQHARVPEPAAAAIDSDGSKSMKRGGAVLGVTVWDDGDRTAVTELISKHGAAAVERAAATVSAAGQKPLPTAVAAELRPKPQRHPPVDAGGEALAAIKARELARPESPTAVGAAELAKCASAFGVRRGVPPDRDGKEQGDAP